MTLATADGRGRPDARTVLLKSFDARGFVFATNYESRKGREIEANPYATLLFYFPALEQQIRIEGRIARVSAAESDEIFMARPRGSRIGAMASPQSRVIASRKVVENRVAALEKELASVEITRPAHWGGYRVKPRVIEFWQGRENRLHDRLRYTKTPRGWTRVRLAP
jgi:pyridoxamine 5'-phosphate oxidase